MKILAWSKKKNEFKRRDYLISIAFLLLITGVDLTNEEDLSGSSFNFLAYHNPPFDILIQNPNGTFTFTESISINIFNWLSKRLKCTISFVLLNNDTLINKFGMHGAAFNLLMNDKNIDGITVGFYLTMDRVEKFDYTAPAWSEDFSFTTPKPGEESRLFAFVYPFQPMVWISIFTSIFFIIGMMTCFTWFYNRHNTLLHKESNIQAKRERTMGFHMIYVINIMTNQGSREAYSRTSFRLLAGVWVLCATVLVNSYTGIVTSSLTTPKLKPSVNTLEELAVSKEVKIVIRSDTSTGIQILQATSGIYKVLGDQMRSEPDRIFDNPNKIGAKLETGHFAFPFLHSYSLAFVGSHYKKEKKCRFQVSKLLPLSQGHYSVLLKKGSWFTKAFSDGVYDLVETGLTRFWVKSLSTIPRADECMADNKRAVTRRVRPIQLSDLTSAFLILGIGIGLAILTFLIETIYSTWKRFKRH